MCGIFGVIGDRQDAAAMVLTGLKTLEYRGYDSWGVATVPAKNDQKSKIKNQNEHTIIVKKRVGKIGDATVTDMPASSLSFGHTRWATHGGVTEVNAHPHLDCTGEIAVIHNGIIENYETLKNKIGKKHVFVSQTDSEVAAHMIEDTAKTESFSEAVRKTFLRLEGSNAIIAISSKERKIVALRRGSPLVVGFGKKEFFVASDAAALLPYTKDVYYLEDDDMAIVSDRGIEIFDCKTNKKKNIRITHLHWTVEQAKKGTYESFMLKEMNEQPGVIKQISGYAHLKELPRLVEAMKRSYGTYLIGCGSAYYSCIASDYLFSTIARRHVNTAVASEFGYHLDFLTKKSLVIALSQSGETMDIIESVKKAKAKGATLAALVNVVGSTLYRMADIAVPMNIGPEIGVASTKDMIAKLSHLIMLSYAVAGKTHEGEKLLARCAGSVTDILGKSNSERIRTLAKKLKSSPHIFVVGRGLSYPAALETALKIKEISYIHAEGLAAGELKHGPLALIEKGTPCVVFIPADETYGANLAAAMEMKARGGYVIGVSDKPHDVFDTFLPVGDCGPATIIPNIVTGQLLAYYLTIEKGLDPDKPRNLAKSVTVK